MFRGITAFDEKTQKIHQWLYDYCWDRWGVLIGTFRSVFITLAYAVDAVCMFIADGMNASALYSVIIYMLMFVPMLWFFYLKDHLNKDNYLQVNGKFDRLNARALIFHGHVGMAMRVVLFVFLVALAIWFTNYWWQLAQRFVGATLVLSWCWSLGVLVRERNEARFQKKAADLAYGGAS